MGSKHLKKSTIAITYVVFIVGWIIRITLLDLDISNEYISWAFNNALWIIWWPLFAFVLIRKYSDELNVSLKEMVTTKPKLKILIPLMVFAIAYNLAGYFVDKSGYGTSMKLYDLIFTAAAVGIFEESVFRGWFLNAISVFTSERKANIIASLLFVSIHYPAYIINGIGFVNIIMISIPMFVLSLLFGLAFRKNRSIWTSAIFHSFWDLLTWILPSILKIF